MEQATVAQLLASFGAAMEDQYPPPPDKIRHTLKLVEGRLPPRDLIVAFFRTIEPDFDTKNMTLDRVARRVDVFLKEEHIDVNNKFDAEGTTSTMILNVAIPLTKLLISGLPEVNTDFITNAVAKWGDIVSVKPHHDAMKKEDTAVVLFRALNFDSSNLKEMSGVKSVTKCHSVRFNWWALSPTGQLKSLTRPRRTPNQRPPAQSTQPANVSQSKPNNASRPGNKAKPGTRSTGKKSEPFIIATAFKGVKETLRNDKQKDTLPKPDFKNLSGKRAALTPDPSPDASDEPAAKQSTGEHTPPSAQGTSRAPSNTSGGSSGEHIIDTDNATEKSDQMDLTGDEGAPSPVEETDDSDSSNTTQF